MLVFILLLQCAWTESFETQDYFPPNDWIIVNEDALDAIWYRDAAEGHTGVHSATCYGDSAYSGLTFTNLDYLITPQVLPQSNDTLITFWYRVTSSAGCSLDVMISTTSPPAMPSFNLLQTSYVTEPSWTEQSLSLSSYSGSPVYVAFRVRRVPTSEHFYLDDITLPNITSQPTVCNGRLRTKGPPSQKYLQVWGSHYEMGYAHGYLLGEEVMANVIRRLIGNSPFYHMFLPGQWEGIALPYFRLRYCVPDKYEEEAQGLYNGMIDKGVDLYHPALGREFTVEDLLCTQGSTDFFCSNVSGWGQSTINDDSLQGGLVIARNTDFPSGQYTSLGNTCVIIASHSDAPGEQGFLNLTWAGIFGASSAVNSQGVGFCIDMGNHSDTSYIPPNSLIAPSLSFRNAVETIDPDSNGVHDVFDIANSIEYSTLKRGWAVHLFSPYDVSHPTPAAILEVNNVGDSLRFVTDNNLSPSPIYSDWNLAATTHHRVLYPPVYCTMYQKIADSLNSNYRLTTQRACAIMNATAQSHSFQFMVFRPNFIVDYPDWACVGASYACRGLIPHIYPTLWYSWNELFEGMIGVEEFEPSQPVASILQINPNPFTQQAKIRFTIEIEKANQNIREPVIGISENQKPKLTIYDVAGRLVKQWDYLTIRLSDHIMWDGTDQANRRLPSGAYFVRFKTGDYSETRKILLIR